MREEAWTCTEALTIGSAWRRIFFFSFLTNCNPSKWNELLSRQRTERISKTMSNLESRTQSLSHLIETCHNIFAELLLQCELSWTRTPSSVANRCIHQPIQCVQRIKEFRSTESDIKAYYNTFLGAVWVTGDRIYMPEILHNEVSDCSQKFGCCNFDSENRVSNRA